MGSVTVSVAGLTARADYTVGRALVYDSLTDAITKWTRENGQASNTASYDLASNVTENAAGEFLIRGAREAAPNGAAFTSGDAKGLHAAVDGDDFDAEVEATNTYGVGQWPCDLWFRPVDGGDGELDVMEQFGTTPYVKTTIHGPYTPDPMVGRTRRWDTLANPDPAARHTYRIEKRVDSVTTYVDGMVIGSTITRAQAIAAGIEWDRIYASGRRFYPRFNLQLGCGTKNPSCATGMPPASFTTARMTIHRIRIWS